MTGKLRSRRLQDFSAIAMIALDSIRTKNRESFIFGGASQFGKQSTKKEGAMLESSSKGMKAFKVLIANDDSF